MKIRNRKSNEINGLNPLSIFLAQFVSPVFYMKSAIPSHAVSPLPGFTDVIWSGKRIGWGERSEPQQKPDTPLYPARRDARELGDGRECVHGSREVKMLGFASLTPTLRADFI
jgi:hypothetical protein